MLITGACGYLGARLSKYLAEKGYIVTVFDSYDPSAYNQWASLMNDVIIGDGTWLDAHAHIKPFTTIGKDCVIAHQTLVHCVVTGNNVLIANGAKVVGAAGAQVNIGEGSIIGAGALVTAGTNVEPNTVMMGFPAKPVREVDDRLRQVQQGPLKAYLNSRETYKGDSFKEI